MTSEFVSSLLWKLLFRGTSLELFIIWLFMLDHKLSEPSVGCQALYMFLLIFYFLTTIWRCVHHSPFDWQVYFSINNLNLEFVLGQRIDHFLDFNVLFSKSTVTSSNIFSRNVINAVFTEDCIDLFIDLLVNFVENTRVRGAFDLMDSFLLHFKLTSL